MNGRIPVRNLHQLGVDIIRVAADEAGLSSQRELQIALRQGELGFLAFCDVDVGAGYTLCGTVTIVRYEAAGLDPSDLTAGTDNTVLARVFAAPAINISLEVRLQPWQIIRVNSSSPIGAAGLYGSLRQVVDSRVTRRNLHVPRANVERKASHQSNFSSDGELCVALCQCLLRLLALGDVASDAKQLHGSAVRLAHDRTFDRNPAFSTTALLISARCETVLGSAAAASTTQCHKGSVQIGKIVWMDLRPHLRKGLWWRFRAMPVNAPIAHVIFEAAGFQVKAPDTKLGTIESQLQPIVAVFERCLIAPPLGEQRGESERAC